MKSIVTTLAALALAGPALAQTSAEPMGKSLGDEELALAALEGLMSQSPERAVPILKRVLAGSQTKVVKQRALFVLGQLETPEANEMLLQMARSTDGDLRGEAIRSIGIGGDPKTVDALLPLYNAGAPDVKKRVLEAWMIARRKEMVYQVAVNAKTDAEADEAIRLLGAMDATDELRKLADRPNSTSGLIDAFAVSGDLQSLRKIAEGNGDRSLRLKAVRQIGIIDGDPAKVALREIYTRAADADIKDAALQGMMIADDDKGLLTLYQASTNTDEKRALLRMLMHMDSDVALQVIDSALEKK